MLNKEDVVIEQADRLQRALQIAASAVSNNSGNDIFRELAVNITKALDVKYAYIGEISCDNEDSVEVIAGCFNGEFIQGLRYGLEGTPCKTLSTRPISTIRAMLRHCSPNP